MTEILEFMAREVIMRERCKQHTIDRKECLLLQLYQNVAVEGSKRIAIILRMKAIKIFTKHYVQYQYLQCFHPSIWHSLKLIHWMWMENRLKWKPETQLIQTIIGAKLYSENKYWIESTKPFNLSMNFRKLVFKINVIF